MKKFLISLLAPLFIPSERCMKSFRWTLTFSILFGFLPAIDITEIDPDIVKLEIPIENEWIVHVMVMFLACYNLIIFYSSYVAEALQYRDSDLSNARAEMSKHIKTSNNYLISKRDAQEMVDEVIAEQILQNRLVMHYFGAIRSFLVFFTPLIIFIAAFLIRIAID